MTSEVPIKYQPLFTRVERVESKSKAEAIKAFCLRCVGYRYKGVRNCSSKGCPLYQVRPYQNFADGSFPVKAVLGDIGIESNKNSN